MVVKNSERPTCRSAVTSSSRPAESTLEVREGVQRETGLGGVMPAAIIAAEEALREMSERFCSRI